VTKYEDIKLTHSGVAAGSKKGQPKPPKTTVQVKFQSLVKKVSRSIDNLNEPLIYTDNITTFLSNYKFTSYLGIPIGEIAAADIPLVAGKTNWYTIDEYLDKKLLSKYTLQELEEEKFKIDAVNAYRNYQYLKGHLPKEFDVCLEHPKITNYREKQLLEFLVNNGKVQLRSVPDVFQKYPLLRLTSEYSLGQVSKQEVIDYIKMVDAANVASN
jgi:hypothetical protein